MIWILVALGFSFFAGLAIRRFVRRPVPLEKAIDSIPGLAMSFPGSFVVISHREDWAFVQLRKPDGPTKNVVLLAVPRIGWADARWEDLTAAVGRLGEKAEAMLRADQDGTRVEFLEITIAGELEDVSRRAHLLAHAVLALQGVDTGARTLAVETNLRIDPARHRLANERFWRKAVTQGPSRLARRMARRQVGMLERDKTRVEELN